MKKSIFVITFLVSLVAVSVALAAVSSPCGARKPVKREVPAPRVEEEGPYKRDVMGNKVPVQTDQAGNCLADEGSRYYHTLTTSSTGTEK